ncbi:hypothetical protein MTY66_62510 (plasmid) [Mycolicibacterium sp. TY66]|nr:hypothetical protein MTY66_62510 [Mycolicibacterium sp. TY66]BCJ84856.1 hypothetical protein MTY81_62290 [Mycolicibacterium sp. TY81]
MYRTLPASLAEPINPTVACTTDILGLPDVSDTRSILTLVAAGGTDLELRVSGTAERLPHYTPT